MVTDGAERALTARLGAEPFIDLVTFRSDGRPVHTPVWVGTDGQRLFVSTFGDSGKVARIRADPRVAVAPCGGRGEIAPGTAYVTGRCELLTRSEFRPGVRAFKAKYGRHFSLMWATRWGFRLVGKPRVWLLITLTPDIVVVVDPPPPGPPSGTSP